MCSVLVANTIVELLDEKVQNGEVFTAFDITSAARKTTDDNVRHNDVRNILNNEFITNQMTGYKRELCTLYLSNSPQALVYFPDTKSASDHPLVLDIGVPVSQPVSQSISQPVATNVTVDLDVDEVATTKEGRVQIPRKILDKVTPNAGSYDVVVSGTLKCASKDARGDVRVCLKQFGITDSKVKVTVDDTNNTIVIETV